MKLQISREAAGVGKHSELRVTNDISIKYLFICLFFSASISCTDLVSLPLALSIIVEDTGQVLSLQREWEADSEISKMFC